MGHLKYRKNLWYPLSGIGLLTFSIRDWTLYEETVLSTQSIAWGGGAC